METWKQNAWVLQNVNESDIRMHSDAKFLLTWPSLLQDFLKMEIAFKSKEICTEKAQFLTLKRSLHLPKDIQREWRVGESKYAKNPYILQISVGSKLINFSPLPFSGKMTSAKFPFQIQRMLSTLKVTPTSTYCTVLGNYATISLWSILAAHTEYLCT